jgi:molybdenum cofactor guanylyltransferase
MAAGGGSLVDVVVLAGGRSSRFGADKVALLLDSVLAAMPADARVVCVGPMRPTVRAAVTWVRERPPMAGPLAAVAAGLAAGRAPVVILAGADMPRVGLAVPALLAALDPGPVDPEPSGGGGYRAADAAVLVDSDGRAQVLASAWRRDRLAARLAELAQPFADLGDPSTREAAPLAAPGTLGGLALRLLLERTALVTVADVWGAARDVDTPADLD